MDELTEDEVNCLRASSKAWYRLPPSCNHDGLPLYIKLCTDMSKEKNTLIVLLTDVSARETPKSTYADLKEKEAVAKLFEDLDVYTNTLDGQATIESKSESEMEVVLQLDGLSFRLRLDMVSPALQSRLLYDLVYLPLLGIAKAVRHNGQEVLPTLQHAIDQQSKDDSLAADSEVLSAMQRFSQGSAGVPIKNRVVISSLKNEQPKASPSKGRSSTPKSSPKKPTSKSKKAPLPDEVDEEEDADKTMLSSPEAEAGPSKASSTIKESTASPSPAKHTRASSRIAVSPSPSPPLSTRSKNKGKARHIAESDEGGGGGDSDATQESDTEQEMQVDELSPHKKSKTSKEVSPPAKQTSRKKSPSPAAASPVPSPAKTRKKTPTPESAVPAQSSPQAPILKRPAAGVRGMPPKRGKRPGMQWSNFG